MNSLKLKLKEKFGSYRAVAKEMGQSPAHLSNLLNGWRRPSLLDIKGLSRLLSMPEPRIRELLEEVSNDY